MTKITLGPGTMTFGNQVWSFQSAEISFTDEAISVPSAPAPVLRDRSPSPRYTPEMRGKARRLGGHPGPMQIKVLRALADYSAAHGLKGMTGQQISREIGETEGSVYGCTSGMIKARGRFWVRFEDIPQKEDQPQITRRIWFITERGLEALELGTWKDHHPDVR